SEHLDFIYHIQNFLSLGIGAPTYPSEIEGRSGASTILDNEGKVLFRPIQIHDQVAEWLTETRHVHASQMLFTLDAVQGNLERYLSNWVNNAEMLMPVYDLFFATRFNPHMYVESAFLSFAQAIETY